MLAKAGKRFFLQWETELLSRKMILHLNKSPVTCFSVVADMDKYPEFVNWINSASCKFISDSYAKVNLTIGFPPITETYLSHVTLNYPYKITSIARNTPVFETLESYWEFYPDKRSLRQNGDIVPVTHCEAHYFVRFRFNSPIYQNMSKLFLDKVCTETSRAFAKRINGLTSNEEVLYNKEKHNYVLANN